MKCTQFNLHLNLSFVKNQQYAFLSTTLFIFLTSEPFSVWLMMWSYRQFTNLKAWFLTPITFWTMVCLHSDMQNWVYDQICYGLRVMRQICKQTLWRWCKIWHTNMSRNYIPSWTIILLRDAVKHTNKQTNKHSKMSSRKVLVLFKLPLERIFFQGLYLQN